MSLPADLKFMGPIGRYELVGDQFRKDCVEPGRWAREVRGNALAHQVGIPVIPLLQADGTRVALEAVSHPRLDQAFSGGIDLNLVQGVGALLARLHRSTEGICHPDLALQRECLLITVVGLHNLGDTPVRVHEQIVAQVTDRLDRYGQEERCSYIHGDLTPQNLFVADSLIPFDWENSCYSDPAYDLATFASFMMQFMAKHERSFRELLDVEDCLLSGYDQEFPLTETTIGHYQFYKVFDRHTMYWFYLFLLREVARLDWIPSAACFLAGTLEDPGEVVRALHARGFRLKEKSLHRICRMLARSPREFVLPCDLVLVPR